LVEEVGIAAGGQEVDQQFVGSVVVRQFYGIEGSPWSTAIVAVD
jgi:hypothetical protein